MSIAVDMGWQNLRRRTEWLFIYSIP